MVFTTKSHPPSIPMRFNPQLLSTPTFGFSAKKLLKIAEFLKKKVNSNEFKKFPATLTKLKQQHQQFMELYERAIIEEKQAKEKKGLKTHWLGYRPRLVNRNDQRLFERLDDRRRMSVATSGRKNYNV
jgi:hypothetical protein